jgi:hypothetical protein
MSEECPAKPWRSRAGHPAEERRRAEESVGSKSDVIICKSTILFFESSCKE